MKNRSTEFFASQAIVIFLLIFSVSCERRADNGSDVNNCRGDSCKAELILALGDLSKIEFSANIDRNEVDGKMLKISKVVDRFDNPQDISSLASLSKVLSTHCRVNDVVCIKESRLIATYDNTFWICVKKLAKNVQQNRDVLERLKIQSSLNDTEKGDWESIVEQKSFP
jgi:hypothetical protein